MPSEKGFHRLVAFSDAVVAIAITLLILPLVDRASSVGSMDIGTFFDANKFRLFAFALSFAVIGNIWWGQHQMFEKVRNYNSVLVAGIFVWLLAIVFLPFPTELVGSAGSSSTGTHAVYIGTILVASAGGLVQQWAIVRWPALQMESQRGLPNLDNALVVTGLMTVAFVATIVVPRVGLWSLLLLVATRPIDHVLARRRAHHRPDPSVAAT
jgi:uncharacterized membrane protein